MAGQGNLEPAAQRETVDRRGDRLAAGFQGAEGLVETEALLEQLRLHLVFRQLGQLGRGPAQFGQVGAGAEGILAGGDDDTLDGVIIDHLGRQRVEVIHDFGGDDIHRLARTVKGDQGNAVIVDFECEVFHVSVLAVH